MPKAKTKNAPVDGKRYPIYSNAMAACKVGCFECGALLDPNAVKPSGRVLGKGTHYVRCECGMVKEFDIQRGGFGS